VEGMGMVELTKTERRLAEVSVRRYHGLLYRKAPLFEWAGVVLFLLGFLRILSRSELYQHSLFTVGFVIFLAGSDARLTGLIGKLYEEILRRESCLNIKN
jgi:hypothetical protein